MEVEITLTPEEAKVAMIELGGAIESAAISRPHKILKWVVFLVVCIVIGYLRGYFNDVFGSGAAWFFLGSVILIAVSIIGLRNVDDLKVASYIRSGSLVEPATYKFHESGISIDGGPIRSDIDWSAIKKLHEGDEMALLFIDPAVAIFIPNRLQESEEIIAMAKERMDGDSPS